MHIHRPTHPCALATLAATLSFYLAPVLAQSSADRAPPVVVSGTVPDEATKASVVARLQELYGPARVVDQLSVGGVVTPPNWSAVVPKLLTGNLKSVSKGQLTVEGSNIALKGEVPNEALRQEIAADAARGLDASYTLKNGLRVSSNGQSLLDAALANRLVEFEKASAQLTEPAKAILDEIVQAMKKVEAGSFEVIGHTDNIGDPAHNLALSRARAQSVKTYLVAHGIQSELIATSGMGADQPVASNSTGDGRRRNRRIEFRVGR
jgi:OOP family OmpA-OmpF porin